ncbi:hypothetical protein [Bacillus sp. IBL03825]|uniref:hypothetical protein n=1 Tax=Bacillus sp. IBL03825 TaxID=2953580 RepID=UPI002157291D|nr:hypothetical protein [Bacillus sp. IBL03825]MCR6850374.1 hypothetical protein [Bacillus sp. IBL03825]
MSNIQNEDRDYLDFDINEIKLCSAYEALRRETRDIEVPENKTLILSPANREFASAFSRVSLESFRDLQLLGFIPHKLEEERIRNAIAKDDDEIYRIAITTPNWNTRKCSCVGHVTENPKSVEQDFHSTYNNIRERYHPTLANLLSEFYRIRISADSPLASNIKKVITKWDRLRSENNIAISTIFKDIVINRGGTLIIPPINTSLLAHNIWFHQTANMIHQGSYLKIWASAIHTFRNLSVEDLEAWRREKPSWLIKN